MTSQEDISATQVKDGDGFKYSECGTVAKSVNVKTTVPAGLCIWLCVRDQSQGAAKDDTQGYDLEKL